MVGHGNSLLMAFVELSKSTECGIMWSAMRDINGWCLFEI